MITFQPQIRLRLVYLYMLRPMVRLLWLDRGMNTGMTETLSLN